MLAVINNKLNGSVEWVRGSDQLYQLILLNDDGTVLDASAVSTTVVVDIYLQSLKTGSPISITASAVSAATGEFTFLVANNQASLQDIYVGNSFNIDVKLDLAAAGNIEKQINQISLEVA